MASNQQLHANNFLLFFDQQILIFSHNIKRISLKCKMQIRQSTQVSCPQRYSRSQSVEVDWTRHVSAYDQRWHVWLNLVEWREISLLGVLLSSSIAWSLESSMGLPLPYKATAPGMAHWQSQGIYSWEWGFTSDWGLFEVHLKCAIVKEHLFSAEKELVQI